MSLITDDLSMPSLSVIIPCFNESQNVRGLRDHLLPTITQLGEKGPLQLIFVDDGSTDDTWDALIETFSIHVNNNITVRFERHPKNLGLGAALRTGISVADGSIIITTDSDGTYAFELIPEMIEMLKDDVDLVTASPYHPSGSFEGVPAHRLILSRGSSLIYRILVNWNVYTYTSLFRAYRREIFDHIKFESDGFLACAEILVKAHFTGHKVKDFPAVLRVRKYGVSKAKLVRTTLAHLKFLSRIMKLRIKTLRANLVRSEKL